MSKILLIAILSLHAFLSACSTGPIKDKLLGPELQRKDWDSPSEVYRDLVELPLPRGRIGASVYNFRDLTGQYKPAPSSGFSTAVSQGAASMLIKAIKDSGWFSPLEREGLQDLLTERKIIRAALKNSPNGGEVPPLLGANVLLEGGIIGYETNMKTGGMGAKYFGVGMSEQYRVDQVTVNLRAVDVNTGRVINSVTTSRSILSHAVQGGAFRFVRFKRLLEIEAGYTRNEPVQLCLLEAIQAAVMRIIVEGVEDNSWSLANRSEMNHPLLFKYGTRRPPSKAQLSREAVAAATANRNTNPPNAQTRTNMASAKAISAQSAKTKRTVKFTDPLAKNMKSNSASLDRRLKKSIKSRLAKNDAFEKMAYANMVKADREENADEEWVIQLISSASAMEIIEFAKKNKLKRDMIEYIHYQVRGKDHFAILYGLFFDKTRAIRAIESLPPRLRVYEPWVRAKKEIG